MILGLAALRWLCVLVFSGALGMLLYALLCAPSRPAARLGIRGLMRQRAIEDSMWRAIEPVIRWLGVRLSGVLSEAQSAKLERQLLLAGDYLGLTPPEYVAFSVVTFLIAIPVGLLTARMTHMGAILVLACALFGAGLPYLLIAGEAEKRLKSISRRLPGAIDLIALAMSAGLDFPGAIRQVVERSSDPFEPLTQELGWILHKLSLGTTRRQALEEFGDRVPVEVVLEFVGAVAQAEERGHPVSRVLQIQAATSRQRRSVRAEESAAKAGVALVGPLVLLFVGILLLIVAPMVLRLGHSGIFEG
jgi:tight adherence protein C